jgi:hypothetical protein
MHFCALDSSQPGSPKKSSQPGIVTESHQMAWHNSVCHVNVMLQSIFILQCHSYRSPNRLTGPSPKRLGTKQLGPIRHDGNFVSCRVVPPCLGGHRNTGPMAVFGPGRHGGPGGPMGRDSGRVRPSTICCRP